MAVVTDIKLGYGGGATIDGAAVFVTSGSMARSLSVPSIRPFSTPNTNSNRAAVICGYGVYTYSGSLGFDATENAITTLLSTSSFFRRNSTFDVVIGDGNKKYKMSDCKFDSFSITASANSLVTGQVSFQSASNFVADTSTVTNVFNPTTYKLVKYWKTGATGVESFTLTVNQALTPVYLNNDSGTDTTRESPAYIRAGLWDITLQVTAFTDFLTHCKVSLGPKSIELTTGITEGQDWSYGGQTATGAHNYTFKAFAVGNSGASFFTIT